jgi:hypothetical protein
MIKMKYIIAAMALLISSAAYAHEMVPTYPKMSVSHIDGLQKTTMTIFNKRAEVEYYEVGVFTEEWEPIAFVSNYKIYKIPYLSTVSVEIYIRNEDKKRATFICSMSKLRKKQITRTAVKSRICSRVKQ